MNGQSVQPIPILLSTMVIPILLITIVSAGLGAQESRPVPPPAVPNEVARPIDFARIDREIGKLPGFSSQRPIYGLFLFGLNGQHRVWAVLDQSGKDPQVYDILYLDRNADGDLTGEGERIDAGEVTRYGKGKSTKFAVGDFREPGGKVVHREFVVTWTEPSVRYTMKWRGEKITMGGYGPTRETYQDFAASPAKAPVFVPGYDRPFEFEHWMSGTFQRGQVTDFKVFVGNRGDRTGAFSCVDQKFLPAGAHLLATLLYRDVEGKRRRHQARLTGRC